MAQVPDSTKAAALPSEKDVTSTHVGETDEQRIEHVADEMAERANNRTKSYEDTAPDQQIFTK
jgi:aspartate/methionine/tyrosine aminotransferase